MAAQKSRDLRARHTLSPMGGLVKKETSTDPSGNWADFNILTQGPILNDGPRSGIFRGSVETYSITATSKIIKKMPPTTQEFLLKFTNDVNLFRYRDKALLQK